MNVVTVQILDVKPGMIVDEAVCDEAGRMLIPAAIKLTPLHVSCLSRWKIASIRVRQADGPSPQEESAGEAPPRAANDNRDAGQNPPEGGQPMSRSTRVRIIEVEVRQRFSNLEKIPVMRDLRDIILRHLTPPSP